MVRPSLLANKNLTAKKPTNTMRWNLQILGNRIGLQLDYYNRTAKGTICRKPSPMPQNGVHYRRYQPGFDQEARLVEVGLNRSCSDRELLRNTSNFSINKNRTSSYTCMATGTN